MVRGRMGFVVQPNLKSSVTFAVATPIESVFSNSESGILVSRNFEPPSFFQMSIGRGGVSTCLPALPLSRGTVERSLAVPVAGG